MSIPSSQPQTPASTPPDLRQSPRGLIGALCSIGLIIVAAGCAPLQLPEGGTGGGQPEAGAAGRGEAVAPAPPGTVTAAGAGRVALLLPLSGAQRILGAAIRDGFLAAYLADEGSGGRPEIRIFDEERPGPVEAYQAAVAAGATAVVGPLLKESVAQIVTQATIDRPTLTLNYVDVPMPTPERFYQFSLAPEDEARQVADRAADEGRLRAVALVPDSEWGRRMLAAFLATLEERGGTVLAYRFYDPGATDFTAQIQRLLLIDESRARHHQLSANLGVQLEFEPRRRSDVDVIFLAANVATGRLIWPQLRFLYAGDIPTYSTSAIYQPGSDGDPDLDGVMFVDAPAVLGIDPRGQDLEKALSHRWPEGAIGRMRFYAMGFDAYTLIKGMQSGGLTGLSGLSGSLSLDARRRIHRTMPWAQFRNGQIVPLVDAGGPGAAAALAPR